MSRASEVKGPSSPGMPERPHKAKEIWKATDTKEITRVYQHYKSTMQKGEIGSLQSRIKPSRARLTPAEGAAHRALNQPEHKDFWRRLKHQR